MIKLNPDWKYKEVFPTISAYVTAYNCLKNGYPILEAVKSFAWCDEVVVVDGGSEDGTVGALESLGLENLNVYPIPLDWENPGKDGTQKAMARAMCTKDVTIQFDADEVCLGDPKQWKCLAKDMDCDILELPVLEPFGDICNLRLNKEHNPVKWRIFKNKAEITHGIPKNDRVEKDGKIYSSGHSDGCFPIHIVNEHLYPSMMSKEAREIKHHFQDSRPEGEQAYKELVGIILETERPAVLHLGHVDLWGKIRLFLNEWRKWWAALYDKDPEDLSMYFDEGSTFVDILSDVTLIESKVIELKEETPTIKIPELEKYRSLTNGTEGRSV